MIIVGLGSNLSFNGRNSQEIIAAAQVAISQLGTGLKSSHAYSSPAWPDPTGPSYVNAVVSLTSEMPAKIFLKSLHAIEAAFGRTRGYVTDDAHRYAPRSLDLDLIDYKGDIKEGNPTQKLVLPHSSMHLRDFVLLPLQEIAPSWKHPILNKTVDELLEGLPGRTAKMID